MERLAEEVLTLAAERDDAQYEAERAGAAATRKALAASEAVFAKRLSDSDRAAAASTSALVAAADAKRFEALRAERAAGDVDDEEFFENFLFVSFVFFL